MDSDAAQKAGLDAALIDRLVINEKRLGGICADLLPQYFELADGKVRVKAGAEAGQGDAALADAAADCPSGSICR